MHIEANEIIGMVFVLIAAFFLIMLGVKMHKGDSENRIWFWVAGILLFFMALSNYQETIRLGNRQAFFILMMLLPTMSFIVSFLIDTISSYRMQQRVRAGFLSGAGGVISYLAGNALFGFGIPEASLAAAIAAMTLGVLGYTA